jgi:hypothetical protein
MFEIYEEVEARVAVALQRLRGGHLYDPQAARRSISSAVQE